MSPIQQMLLGVGAVATKTFVDDVFSTFLYTGTGANPQSINNGIDMSKGGLVWVKSRVTRTHDLYDTERGTNSILHSDSVGGASTVGQYINYLNNGFSLTSQNLAQYSGENYCSWTFRKAKGFFDVVTWDGDGSSSNRDIPHNLGSIPGMIIMKAYTHPSGVGNTDWQIYHRGLNGGVNPEQYALMFSTGAEGDRDWFGDTAPTATQFTIGSGQDRNGTGGKYVAYIFAGGSAGGSSANIDITGKTVTSIGGAFESEYPLSNVHDGVAETSNAVNIAYVPDANGFFDIYVDLSSPHVVTKYRIAPQGGSNLTYNNPTLFEVYATNNTSSWNYISTVNAGTSGWVAGNYREFQINTVNTYRYWRIRVVANNGGGTSISEWKLEGYSQAIDTTANIFGDAGDESVIKCGSYVGNGSTDGPEINLGFEPQWLMIKWTSSADGNVEHWHIFDSMRGIITDEKDPYLRAGSSGGDSTGTDGIDLTPTGFKIKSQYDFVNNNGTTYVFLAVRRPDGYVGKPPELGTDVFAMDTGAASWTIPNFDSGFPVDMGLYRRPAVTDTWYLSHRLLQGRYLRTNLANSDGGDGGLSFDSNVGWAENGKGSEYQSWQWKRHAGFTTVAYEGDGVAGRRIAHDMNNSVGMIWIKNRDSTKDWVVGHQGLNGGTNPWEYHLVLNDTVAESDSTTKGFNDTAPTSTHFTLGSHSAVNAGGNSFIAMLFASVEGISKVGSYTGSDSTITITTGFQPRFLMVKNRTSTGTGYTGWYIVDTTRGWASGNDQWLRLDSNVEQGPYDFGAPTSTGFTLTGNNVDINDSGSSYIYYCHA